MRTRLVKLITACGLLLVATTSHADRSDYVRPDTIPFPDNAPYDPQIATLGKMLFFDPRISGAQNMSCATCHNPSFGWEAPVPTAVGALNSMLGRHAPTVLNSAWIPIFFWDGRSPTLEHQARGPITASVEMNAQFDDVIERLSEVEEYRYWFERLFPNEGLSERTILSAIATYERTVVSGWAPFDDWVAGDDDAISASAQRGFELFNGKAHCADCHSGWNFTDNEFHDIGLSYADIGRAAIAPEEPRSEFAFKTPGLRNISLRAPYMHAGQVPDLEAVIAHYAGGGMQRPSLSPEMQPFTLTDQEVGDLIAFLETLTERETNVPTPILPAN